MPQAKMQRENMFNEINTHNIKAPVEMLMIKPGMGPRSLPEHQPWISRWLSQPLVLGIDPPVHADLPREK